MARRSERLRRRHQSSTPGLSPAAYSIHAGAYVCESEASLATSSLRLPEDSRRAKYNHAAHALIEESPITSKSPPRPNGLRDSYLSKTPATPSTPAPAPQPAVGNNFSSSAGTGSPHAARAIHVLMALVILGAVVLYALGKAKSISSSASTGTGTGVSLMGFDLRHLMERCTTTITTLVGFAFGGAWRRRAGQITRAEWTETLEPRILEQMREIAREEARSAQAFEAHRERYAADKGLPPDYALASAGAKVLWSQPNAATQLGLHAYNVLLALKNRLALPPIPRQPSAVLDPDVAPGQCWAFRGKAAIVIRVARPVRVNAVSVEHTPSMSAYYTDSAPKNIRISILEKGKSANDIDAFQHLAQVRYVPDKVKHIQTFQLPTSNLVAKAIKFDIIDNNGADLTCVYRLRVHGLPAQ